MEPVDNNHFYFHGVDLESINHVEYCFKINISVYNKSEKGVCSILRQSLGRYGDNLNLREYMGHLSYIKNFSNYAKKFECNRCDKAFRRKQDFKRHFQACPNAVKHNYPGGYFALNRNIFEVLEEIDILVPKNERFYVLRFESYA